MEKYLQNLSIYFNIFVLPFSKILVITNRDDESVICVIDINKIILYFRTIFQVCIKALVAIALLTIVVHHHH